ncbi:MAG: sigma-70 family RNA polymerase sigma factor [Planctomycetota bacterium]
MAVDTSSSNSGGDPTRVGEFLELYSAHYARLQFYLMALLPAAGDAADVLQETSLVLWRKFDTFESGTNFYAWACKIARLQALKHRERLGRAARVLDIGVLEQLADEAAEMQADPSSERREMLGALSNCVERLPEADQALIRKRYQPDATVKRMAEELGRSANSLSKSLGRIRRALLECVERRMLRELRE